MFNSYLSQAVKSGLLKILSKMGISLLSRFVYLCHPISRAMLSILRSVNFLLQLFNSSTLFDSYCGAQIFEIYGLGQEVVDLAFCGSVSKIGGLTLDEVTEP